MVPSSYAELFAIQWHIPKNVINRSWFCTVARCGRICQYTRQESVCPTQYAVEPPRGQEHHAVYIEDLVLEPVR